MPVATLPEEAFEQPVAELLEAAYARHPEEPFEQPSGQLFVALLREGPQRVLKLSRTVTNRVHIRRVQLTAGMGRDLLEPMEPLELSALTGTQSRTYGTRKITKDMVLSLIHI